MNHYKKIAVGFFSFLLLFVLLHIGLNFWISFQLPKIINRENNSPYKISYKNADISLISSSIHAGDIVITPKRTIKDTEGRIGIYANIKAVDIVHFSLWDMLFSNKIKAKSITLTQPEIVLYKKTEKAINNSRSISSDIVKPFEKVILVSDIFVNKGNLKIVYIKTKKELLNAANITIRLQGIVITDKILEQKIPFSYKSYAFICDSLYYANGFYDLRTHKIATTDKGMNVKKFEMIPRVSRREFVSKIPKEKDFYTLKAEDITIRNMDWGFKNAIFFLNADAIALDQVSANIYRNKIPPDDLKKKYLYNKLLRDLKFDLKIDTLAIRNSLLMYEEEKTFQKGPGKLKFSKFNLFAKNIHSGLGQKKLPDLVIKIKCIFMEESRLDIDWTLNVMDKTDGFNINGRLYNFDAEKMNPFIKPYMNAQAKGKLNEVYFNFSGNDISANGDFALKYDDFKISVYQKKDHKKKNKLLTSIVNLFAKNDSKGDVKNVKVALKRIPEKSFYNFLWRSIAEGLKKIMV
jgi:hypothetical protein